MDRDELIILLLSKYNDLPVKIIVDGITYDVLEQNIFQCADAIIIQPD